MSAEIFIEERGLRGTKLLHDPIANKGTAFTEEERDLYGLRGLLPPRIQTQEEQVMRVMGNLRAKTTDLERYVFLVSLQDRNETLFYRVVTEHLDELMKIVYTPTVGEACQVYGHIYRRPRGLWISSEDRGRVRDVLQNWPHEDVRIIVVTDGERILGLGDLGAAGMGIPVGKLVLYTACAGISPEQCLPVTIDVGTNNVELLTDPLYVGLQHRRIRGEEYEALIEEFMEAVTERYPHAIVQLEDFATENAFRLLQKYRDRYCTFDDDIQGTGSVALAGILAALRVTGGEVSDRRYLFLGSGEAGIGIAHSLMAAMVEEGLSEDEARLRCWFFDSKGLVVAGRTNLAAHKKEFAHEHPFTSDFLEAVRMVRPAALIGVSGVPGTFTRPVLEAMAALNERPIIFALSNPTSKSECTAEDAFTWTAGRAIFASGSPFEPVVVGGRTLVPGQANNAYIFPGVGLGAMAAEARTITDEMFYVAARTLADEVTDADLALGRLFPSLKRIREVSLKIAVAVADVAYRRGLTDLPRPADLTEFVRAKMFEPVY